MSSYIQETCIPVWHVSGSCAMLPQNQGGVVNDLLQVYGVSGLRVVDTSIFPIIMDQHTQVCGHLTTSERWFKLPLTKWMIGPCLHGRGEGSANDSRYLWLLRPKEDLSLVVHRSRDHVQVSDHVVKNVVFVGLCIPDLFVRLYVLIVVYVYSRLATRPYFSSTSYDNRSLLQSIESSSHLRHHRPRTE